MLRLLLDWFSRRRDGVGPLRFGAMARWYSEALLPSPFLARFRADPLAESYTHCDGAIGHFTIGNRGEGDLALHADARQFVILEAKMFSRLSPGIRNVPGYDQAARTVACMVETLRRAGVLRGQLDSLAFHVVAPERRIREGIFASPMEKDSILRKVEARVAAYGEPERREWFENSFTPVLEAMNIGCISWEELLEWIGKVDEPAGRGLRDFYEKCLEFGGRPGSGQEGC